MIGPIEVFLIKLHIWIRNNVFPSNSYILVERVVHFASRELFHESATNFRNFFHCIKNQTRLYQKALSNLAVPFFRSNYFQFRQHLLQLHILIEMFENCSMWPVVRRTSLIQRAPPTRSHIS